MYEHTELWLLNKCHCFLVLSLLILRKEFCSLSYRTATQDLCRLRSGDLLSARKNEWGREWGMMLNRLSWGSLWLMLLQFPEIMPLPVRFSPSSGLRSKGYGCNSRQNYRHLNTVIQSTRTTSQREPVHFLILWPLPPRVNSALSLTTSILLIPRVTPACVPLLLVIFSSVSIKFSFPSHPSQNSACSSPIPSNLTSVPPTWGIFQALKTNDISLFRTPIILNIFLTLACVYLIPPLQYEILESSRNYF